MSYKTMKQSQDWKRNYNWTDKNDHPVEDNKFQPKVLKDQVVKFYKKPKPKILQGGKPSIPYITQKDMETREKEGKLLSKAETDDFEHVSLKPQIILRRTFILVLFRSS